MATQTTLYPASSARFSDDDTLSVRRRAERTERDSKTSRLVQVEVCIDRKVMMSGGRAMLCQIRVIYFIIIECVLSFKLFTRKFEMRLNRESHQR